MATLYFVIAATSGLILTRAALSYAQKREILNPHRYALILAVGFGITWTGSFFAPLFAHGSNVQPNASLFLFGLANSTLVFVLTYGIVRLWMTLKERLQR